MWLWRFKVYLESIKFLEIWVSEWFRSVTSDLKPYTTEVSLYLNTHLKC